MPRLDPRLSHGLVLLILAAGVGIGWQMGYRPEVAQVRHQRAMLSTLKAQLDDVEQMLDRAGGEAEWMAMQEHLLELMAQRFPASHQMPRLLDALLERVKQSDLQLLDVKQGNLEPTHDAQGQPIVLDETPCFGLPITLSLQGRYHAIIEFLQQVASANFAGVAKITQVTMALRQPTSLQLQATVQVVLYVLGEPSF